MRKLTRVAFAVALALAVTVPIIGGTQPADAATYWGIGVSQNGGVSGMKSYENWLGRKVHYQSMYLPRTSWSNFVQGAQGAGKWQGKGYRLVVAVPLIMNTGGTLRQGANGQYDQHFRKVAQTLVAKGAGNAVLRLGWEFDGAWFKWSAAKDPAAFKAYWRRVVRVMRSVSGAKFQFDWNSSGGDGKDPTKYYPGNDVVDIIGLDFYDMSWGPNTKKPVDRWNLIMNRPGGLKWQQNFARQHGKWMSYPEFGLSTNHVAGAQPDNPYYIEQAYKWFKQNASRVLYFNYFEHKIAKEGCFGLRFGCFPKGAAKYRQLFGNEPGAAAALTAKPSSSTVEAAAPAPQPQPTTPPTTAAPKPKPTTTTTAPKPKPTTTTTAPKQQAPAQPTQPAPNEPAKPATPPSTAPSTPSTPPTTAAPAKPGGEQVRSGAVALYEFDEGQGSVVRSSTGTGPDLTIGDASATSWVSGGLRIDRPTVLRSNGGTAGLTAAVGASNALTVEAWITPASATQDGPARVVAIGDGTSDGPRNLLIGQGRWNDQDPTVWDLRIRTTSTSDDGGAAVVTPSGTTSTSLTHLVYTRAADGTATVYLNGVAVASEARPGALSNWDSSFPLYLGNEGNGTRPWLGTFHEVAIYDRALTGAEVKAAFQAGA